jgi:glyoxylase-like metal-dependent hydrolase (beta-lactamase superfamily II)/ferredoxin
MARLDLRHPDNAPGEWYVDDRCIDCGTCRDLAPHLFGDTRDQSIVIHQPGPASEAELDAWLAAQACPTQSIGTASHRRRPGRLFPREIADGTDVYDCGYCSEDSFGATAWFARRADGNVMVDAPRFTGALVGPLTDMGGVDHILLTHRDDVADADRWASHFGSRVWIHEDDRPAAPFATDLLHGLDEVEIGPGLIALPTPGHTRGSTVFLLDGSYLFTGDSLAWSHARADLTAFRTACWYSWPVQTESLARLADRHRFTWVLPGHGARVGSDHDDLHRRLLALVERMRGSGR